MIVRLTTGKWLVPAGHDTTASIVLPVSFTLKDFKCEQRSKDDINAAISTYHARQGLTDAIFNFYDKKALGDYEASEEARILDLKTQLGYNDKFLERLVKQGQRKLKQGDLESACEDFQFVQRLGSDKSTALIREHCK
jgi:hypothetical protein